METSFKPINSQHGHLHILLRKPDIEPEVGKELERIRKTAKIKGFRQGAVPVSMIQKLYGQGLRAEVTNKLINGAVGDYQKQNDLRFLGDLIPVNEPLTDNDFAREEMEFVFEVGISPKPDLDAFIAGHPLKQYEIEFSEKNIDEEVASFVQHFSELQPVEDAIAENDMVLLKVREAAASAEGAEPLESEFSVYMDEHLHEDMKKHLEGRKTGDGFRFNIQHVEKNQTDNIVRKYFLKLQDDDARTYGDDFDAEITKVSRKVKPAMERALFEKAFGPDTQVGTEAELREKLASELKDFYLSESEKLMDYEVSNAITKAKGLDYPDEFLRKWLSTSFEEWKEKSSHDFEHDLIHFKEGLNWELFRSAITATGEVQVQVEDMRNIIISKYKAQIPGLQFTDDQWNQVAMNVLKDREKSQEFYQEALTTRCIQWMRSKMDKTLTPIKLDDFRSMVRELNQKAKEHRHDHEHDHQHEH